MDINLQWDGPLTLEQVASLNSAEDYGLYQYYGDHPVYGQKVLLYVGKAAQQTFGRRLAQHNWHSWVGSSVEVHVGRLCSPATGLDRGQESLIDLAERILLFSHSPAFNTANLNSIGHPGEDVRVLNWGRRRSLFPEVSISRWESGLTLGHELPKGLARIVRSS